MKKSQKFKQNWTKNSSGITLIALVITIIVLLILAGVSLNLIMGNQGILNQATGAVIEHEKQAAKELLELKVSEVQIEKRGKANLQDFVNYLENDEQYEIIDNADEPNYVYISDGTYQFKVDNNLEIEYADSNVVAKNQDYKKILEPLDIDASQYNNLEEVLADEEVVDAILANEESLNCLVNSSNKIVETVVNNQNVLQKLASNENSAKKIIAEDNWYEIIENSQNSSSFFDNLNIAGTETLNLVEGDNPYYTFVAKANQKYFIQCYGAQGGSYSTTNPGGCGGYSFGIFSPKEDTTLYIYKGGAGTGTIANAIIPGGYNGGGGVPETWGDGNHKRASGGGATHIALCEGLLYTLENNKSQIIMVAGGGGRFWC